MADNLDGDYKVNLATSATSLKLPGVAAGAAAVANGASKRVEESVILSVHGIGKPGKAATYTTTPGVVTCTRKLGFKGKGKKKNEVLTFLIRYTTRIFCLCSFL